MPELPEVETVRRGLEGAVAGKIIRNVRLARAGLRFPFPERFAARLQHRRIERLERRAKYLLLQLDGGLIWLAHLGMSGRFNVLAAPCAKPGVHDHVMIEFTDGTALVYNDARRFGIMDLMEAKEAPHHKLLKNLGPEPLSEAFSAAYLKAELLKRRGPVKTALMDAHLVVGVGNIYASEALFAAGLTPQMPACQAAPHAKALRGAICRVLESALEAGGSSLRDFFSVGGEAGYFQHRFQVYGRGGKPCYACGSTVQWVRQAGRSSYFCPSCQSHGRRALSSAKKSRKSAASKSHKKTILGA